MMSALIYLRVVRLLFFEFFRGGIFNDDWGVRPTLKIEDPLSL